MCIQAVVLNLLVLRVNDPLMGLHIRYPADQKIIYIIISNSSKIIVRK